MQNDEIKFRIEEIEKRISKTYKTGNTNNEEIGKRLQSLEVSRTSQDRKINSLIGNVDSLITVDEQHLQEFDNIYRRLEDLENNPSGGSNAQIEENTTAIANLNEDVSALKTVDQSLINEIQNLKSVDTGINNNIENLKTADAEINDELESLNLKINALENSTTSDNNSQSELPETYNFFNKEIFESGEQFYGLMQNFLTCFFLCDPSSICRIKVHAELDLLHDTESEVTLNSYLNDEIIDTRTYTAVGTESHTFDFEYDFYPEKINNNILFKSTAKNNINKTARVILKSYKVEIYGRNVTILNKDLSFKVFICKNKYYLTKNEPSGAYGKIMEVGAADWSENFTALPRINLAIDDASATITDKSTYNNFSYSFFPYATLDSTTNKYVISETDNSIAATLSSNRYTYIVQQSLIPFKFTALSYIAPHDMYMVSTPGESDTEIKNVCFVRYNSNYTLGMNNIKKSGLSATLIKLNGETPGNKWVFNTPVMFKDWEDNATNTYCCIGLDEFGHNYFFPTKAATYCIDLGVGAQTSAFKQADGTINVYMSIANKIFKKVLTFNSATSQYELTSNEFFKNGNEYIEGYYDDYFIKKGRTWSYVPPTNAS